LPGSDLVQFLNQHTDTLKHLRLQHTTPPPSAFQSLDDLNCLLPVFPHLETLDIINGTSYPTRKGHLTSSEGLDAARAYIRHSWGTLTSLSLAHCSFTLHDLGILLDLLGRGPSEDSEGGRLKSLTVTVHYLSPQVLDMLAEKLPQLERLKIEFSDLRSKDSAMSTGEGRRAGSRHLTHEDIEPFLLEMKTRSYSRWSLRSFEIDCVYLRSDRVMAILMPLAPCIPHLVEIEALYMKVCKELGSTWKASNFEDHYIY